MSTYITTENNTKYLFCFCDSIYAFHEDLEETINDYLLIGEIPTHDIKSMLFKLHTGINKLKSDYSIDNVIISDFGLSEYGNGPAYENSTYFILGGEYLVIDITLEKIILKSSSNDSQLHVLKDDEDYFFDHFDELEIEDKIDFDGINVFVFVNREFKVGLERELCTDIQNFNRLLDTLNIDQKLIQKVKIIGENGFPC